MELNIHRAATCHPRADARIALLLWHLAERWGIVVADGILVPLPLTHRLIGQLVGAERPSVSHALARLSSAGLVTRDPNGLVLHGTAAHHIACLVERSEESVSADVRHEKIDVRDAQNDIPVEHHALVEHVVEYVEERRLLLVFAGRLKIREQPVFPWLRRFPASHHLLTK